MPNYQEMYLKLVRATERSIQLLIDAQRECEELYLHGEEPKLTVLHARVPAEEAPGTRNTALK